MKLIQKLLSHSFLIILVVIIAVGYLYREQLFPERFAQQADEDTTEVATASGTAESASSAPDNNSADTGAADTAEASADAGLPPVVERGSAPGADAGAVQATEAEPVATQVAAADVPPVAAAEPARAGSNETPASTPVASDDKAEEAATAADPEKVWNSARQAYWERDYRAAETFYRALVTMDQDNADAFGELGNLYFQRGQWQQAADAYYEACQRLVDQGDLSRAHHMLRVLRGLDKEKARQLESAMAGRNAAS